MRELLDLPKSAASWRSMLAATVVVFIGPTPAMAEFSPTMDEICTPKPVPGSASKVDSRRLLGLFLKSIGVSEIDMRSDGGDLTYAQKVEFTLSSRTFITDTGGAKTCETSWGGACSIKAATAADGNKAALASFLLAHGPDEPDDQSGIRIVARDPNDQLNLRKFLMDQSAFTTACVIKKTEEAEFAQDPKSNKLIKNLTSRFLVRNKVEDLRYAQSSTEFKGLNRATVSVSDDLFGDSEIIGFEGVAGFGSGRFELGQSSDGEIIPFVSYKRQHVEGNNPKKTPEINNIAFGAVGDVFFKAGFYQDIQFYPKYVRSLEDDTELFSGTLIYTPEPAWPLIGSAYYPFGPEVAFLLTPQAKLVYGDVIDDGDNDLLHDTNDFGRGGGLVKFAVFGEDGFFKGLGFTTSYEYLRVFRGPLKSVHLLQTTLGYSLPDLGMVGIELKYVNGRDPDTLQEQEQIVLGVGVKY